MSVWKVQRFPLRRSRIFTAAGGATVIGMTNLPEAKLAREAEIAYATLALVTDYDCWHPDHDSVTVEMVIANLQRNAINAQKVIQETVRRLSDNPPRSDAHSALKYANAWGEEPRQQTQQRGEGKKCFLVKTAQNPQPKQHFERFSYETQYPTSVQTTKVMVIELR